MRHLLRVLVAVTTVLTAISLPSPADAGLLARRAAHDPAADLRRVEELLYATSMSAFVAFASAGDDWFDTSTDFCTAPLVGTTGRSFDFHDPCRRHDFAYRNLKLLDRRYSCTARPAGATCSSPGRYGTYWNTTSRRRADEQFRRDLRAHCSSRPWYDEPTCFAWSETFYRAVRLVGGP